ncbi:AraC family transcriptional regulator [Planococcus sp. CP5-4]|uniref:helix-turn-helix transcriptional regulator n=1 Tax=unclassified Planococcus (in: firmicutes) TaxID=2662419 RepID=UPI001C240557|nr:MULTISPECIES: AraC family transcriptional regulator [unclassified Planococcus (in: firmicutes)]MBU9674371.1 AraC family transcriptional regulator [Planococcus sp. CP5-4_YE]MBV0909041.1 AraC family transcriptional regulator [Planococcus sp. CP5-4_UN]MBW6065063.1 AraC family transcriptional regulator [Planococcus sp. CP5-4]
MTRDFELHAIESKTVANGQSVHIPLHRHEQLAEWLWVESGELELIANAECLTLGTGALALIPPGQWHALSFASSSEQRYQRLLVTHPLESANDTICFAYPAHPAFLASVMDELARELQQANPASSRQVQLLLRWLYGTAAKPQSVPAQTAIPSKMESILHQMEETCHLPFSLESTAAASALSKFHFSRHFKKSVGQTPLQFVISCRMERARQLLLTSEQSVADIAGDCGYKSPTQFHAAFTRHSGSTPKRFREHLTTLEAKR